MNILVTNFHSIRNKGDLGIVLGLMAGLRRELPDVRFTVVGRRVEERPWWDSRGVDFCTPLLSYRPGPRPRLAALRLAWEYWSSLRRLRRGSVGGWVDPESQRTLGAYARADLVVSKGGSFFREPEYQRNLLPVGILGHLHQLAVALALGKPVAVSAQSFGPIGNPLSKLLLRRVLSRCSVATVRDAASAAFLRSEVKLQRSVPVVADSAFLLEPEAGAAVPAALQQVPLGSGKVIGLTVRSWSNGRQFDAYIGAVAEFMVSLAREGYRFVVMPQVIGPSAGEDDRIVGRKLLERLGSAAGDVAVTLDDEMDPAQLAAVYARMDFFVATRLHSSIFALLSGVPCMAIAYEPKTLGVFTDLSLERYVVDIRDVTAARLLETFRELARAPRAAFLQARDRAKAAAADGVRSIASAVRNRV